MGGYSLEATPQAKFWVLIGPIQRIFKIENGLLVENLLRFITKLVLMIWD